MTTGWRFWKVSENHLVSPFTGDVLTDDGVLTAPACTLPQLGLVGVSFYPDPADAHTAAQLLRDPHIAITCGQVDNPTMPDQQMPLYLVGPRAVHLPAGRRCALYRVTHIYTTTPQEFVYHVPATVGASV